jgi:hypothetical protein
MGATSGKQLPVGLQYANIFALNSDGRPAATAVTAYTGLEVKGAKVWTFSPPKPIKKTHLGNNRVMATDWLPSQEGAESELKASVYDYQLIALLSGVMTYAIGEATAVSMITDKQGFEPDVALHLYQQSLDLTTKVRRWRNILIPSARCIAHLGGMGNDPEDVTFAIAMNPVANHLWGAALAAVTEGALEQAYVEFMSEGPGKFVAYKADGTEDEYTLPSTALSTGKMAVWDNGTPVTTGATKTTAKVTFTAPPTATHDIVIFYEEA